MWQARLQDAEYDLHVIRPEDLLLHHFALKHSGQRVI